MSGCKGGMAGGYLSKERCQNEGMEEEGVQTPAHGIGEEESSPLGRVRGLGI